MLSSIEESRRWVLNLLDRTRHETRSILSCLDPLQVVHDDERAWRVRDVVGHLAVWNGEAARSLAAYANGSQYTVIAGRAEYYGYNGPAADARREWTLDEVWAEYEASHDQLRRIVQAMPVDKWNGEMAFPWSERGTVEQLIKRMMKHEKVDHCDLVIRAASS
jgi:hypothetical protein